MAGLKVDKFPGADELCPRLLWETREDIAGALNQIFNASLATGEVANEWRTVNVVLLLKKDFRDKPGNSRPVSLMSVVGKLLEKLLKESIYLCLTRQDLIRDSQQGFVRGWSCLTKLIEPFEEVAQL